MGTWRITARDRYASRQGVIDVYDKLSFVSRHIDIGAFVLDMSLDDPMVPYLVAPGAGIIVELDDVVQLSGPVRLAEVKIDGAQRSVTLSGPDDLAVLRDRVASPQPSTSAPPYSVSAYDVRGPGVAETVIKAYVAANTGSSALATRRKTGLTIATDQLRGASVTGRARWHNLLALSAELAVLGGLGLRCRNLVFDVYAPVTRGTVEFSDDRESLAAITYKGEAPAATYAFAGGGGEGTARTILEGSNGTALAAGWDRIEVFADRRDTTDTTELTQAITSALIGEQSSSTERTGVTVTTIDTPGTAYGTDYLLGDTVAWVDPWGTRWPLVVQAVTVDLTAQLVTVTPTLGSIVPDIPAQFARLAALARRTARLEVR